MSIQVQLNGTVRSADSFTYAWTKVSGPGSVSFAPSAAVADPIATIDAAGTYVLKLTATDAGGLSAFDTVTITASQNVAPTVSAGADFRAYVNKLYALDGSASDDGFPEDPGTLTTTWSKVSGSGTVTFTDASDPDTTCSFSAADTYVLRLTADDGDLTSTDDVSVVVTDAPGTRYAEDTAAAAAGSLTDVLYMVDLSRLSVDWHNATSANGVNIRVTDHNDQMLPHYVVNYNATTDTGCLFYKRNASTSNDPVRIWTGGAQTAVEPANGTYGQYNTFRSGIVAFYPYGSGNDVTRNLLHLTSIGSPATTTGPIGLTTATTYVGAGSISNASTDYAFRYLGAKYNLPLSLSAVTNKSDNTASNFIGLCGVTNSNNNTVKTELNSISLFLYDSTEIGIARCVSGTTTYGQATVTPSAGTWRNFAATFTSSTRRDVYGGTATGSSTHGCLTTDMDYFNVAAWPGNVWAGTHTTNLCLIGLYSEVLSANMCSYMQTMLDQATMFPSWSDVVP